MVRFQNQGTNIKEFGLLSSRFINQEFLHFVFLYSSVLQTRSTWHDWSNYYWTRPPVSKYLGEKNGRYLYKKAHLWTHRKKQNKIFSLLDKNRFHQNYWVSKISNNKQRWLDSTIIIMFHMIKFGQIIIAVHLIIIIELIMSLI